MIAGGVALWSGQSPLDSVVIGIALALGSTAVAMKSFQDSGQQNNPGARVALGIALFQDLLVIVVFIVLPVLYLKSGDVGGQLGWAVLKGALFLGGAALLGRYGITPLLHAVARTRSRELFTLTVIGLCAGVAFAGGALDLSLALGAFAAGLVVSESIYSHRILSEILPFRDLFLAIFFISVGLLIDLDAVATSWPSILGLSTAILFGKGLIVFGVLWLLKLPGRQALLAAASLASSGEFTLVLIGKAGGYRPLEPSVEQAMLVCTALTMACVPTLMRKSGPFSKWLEKHGWMTARKTVSPELSPHQSIRELADHAIICGYGPVGRSLNEALQCCGMDTLVMELNSETVLELKRGGQRVLFADVTHAEALDLAGISRARLVAFTFPTVAITKVAVPLVRERNPGICIFARAKFATEAAQLHELGVQVIHDEHESAVAMVRAAISSYQRPDVDPDELVAEIMLER
jgi:CPA2 family monovalent cation:H+ antiporter-2